MPLTLPEFLKRQHPIFVSHVKPWIREERRLEGGDAVLTELARFEGETQERFDARLDSAGYSGFPRTHAQTVTGRLRMVAPMPNYGHLGEVRARETIGGRPTLAELIHYNVDGIGSDGMDMASWFDSVDVRAQATGHRWLMVEMPSLADVRAMAGRPEPREGERATQQDVLDGFRPYVVEFSPINVPWWATKHGRLTSWVARVPDEESEKGEQGWYLLLARGFKDLGPEFEEGGWWLLGADMKIKRHGLWENGQIPVWAHYGEPSQGTTERPAMSRSSTMELGQIAVGLMNLTSARDNDFHVACASRLFFLGADGAVMDAVAQQNATRNVYVGVPPTANPDGTYTAIGVHDGSTGAVPAQVSESIINAKYREAQEQSLMVVSSTADSSGRSKEIGDREAKSPYLTRRARMRESSENTFIYFAELRAGFAEPKGFVEYPAQVNLAPAVAEIERTFAMLTGAKLSSPTAEAFMARLAIEENGGMPPDAGDTVEAELRASVEERQRDATASQSLFDNFTLSDGGTDPLPPRAGDAAPVPPSPAAGEVAA